LGGILERVSGRLKIFRRPFVSFALRINQARLFFSFFKTDDFEAEAGEAGEG